MIEIINDKCARFAVVHKRFAAPLRYRQLLLVRRFSEAQVVLALAQIIILTADIREIRMTEKVRKCKLHRMLIHLNVTIT